ncbi:MAG: hypothetical protein PHI11_15225 [Gallionella sp.]|nr:hypothetical protein [Gallionella sp.]
MLIDLSFTEYRAGIHQFDSECLLRLYDAKAFSTNLLYQWQAQYRLHLSLGLGVQAMDSVGCCRQSKSPHRSSSIRQARQRHQLQRRMAVRIQSRRPQPYFADAVGV